MVAGGPGRRPRQARLTGEKRGGRSRCPRRLGRRRDYHGERETDQRHKVGHGARAQALAGKSGHGGFEIGGRGGGRRARVQEGSDAGASTEKRTTEKRRWRAHELADCILVLSSRPLVLIIVTFLNIVSYMWQHSL